MLIIDKNNLPSLEELNKLANDEGFFFLIDKELGVSSFNIIYRLRPLIGVKKIGHAGTLDPLATGLLIVACGKKATTKIDTFMNLQKTYTGEIRIGATTKTDDAEAEEENFTNFDGITETQLENIRQKFVGEFYQTPPIYSAKKIKGKRLYDLARKNIEVKEIKPQLIHVVDFQITKINLPIVDFLITCSKGSYIRAIARDFGKELGVGAYLKALRRTKIGEYSVDNALRMDIWEN